MRYTNLEQLKSYHEWVEVGGTIGRIEENVTVLEGIESSIPMIKWCKTHGSTKKFSSLHFLPSDDFYFFFDNPKDNFLFRLVWGGTSK